MGSSVTLLLFDAIEYAAKEDFVRWLQKFFDVMIVEDDSELSLRISSNAGPGLPSVSSGFNFGISLDWVDLQAGDDYSQMDGTPMQEMAVWVCGSGEEAEKSLGNLVVFLMGKYNSLADFDGLIGPTRWSSQGLSNEFRNRMDYVRPFLNEIPGVLREVGYAMHDGEIRYVHVADDVFMKNWILHPSFHLLDEWQ